MATARFVALAKFTASKVGKTGLTVTCDIDEYVLGTDTVNSHATGAAMTEVRNGLYRYFFNGDDGNLYDVTAKTADSSVDDQQPSGIIVLLHRLGRLDAALTTRAPAATALSNAVWTDAKAAFLTGIVALEATLTALKGAGWTNETLAAIKLDTGVMLPNQMATLASAAALEAVDDLLDTEVGAIKSVTDKLNTALELDGAVYRLTENALEEAPASTATVTISATQATQIAAGQVAIRCHHTFAQTIESTSQEDLTSGELLFAVKINADDDDDDAVVLLSKGEGLTVLAGAAYATAADGAITVNGSAGDWEITLQLTMAATSLLTEHAGAHLTSELKHCPSATEGNPIWTGTTAISKGVVKGA